MYRFASPVAAILLCCALAEPVLAEGSAAPVVGSAAADPMADFEVWMGSGVTWSNEYLGLLTAATEVVGGLMSDAETISDKLRQRNARTYTAWIQSRRAHHIATLDALDQRFAALPPNPPVAPPSIAGEPEVRGLGQHYANVRDRVGTLLRQTRAGATAYLGLMEAAGSGRDGDIVALQAGTLDLLQAQLSAENLMLDSTAGTPGEPGYYFNLAQIATNDTAKVWLATARSTVQGVAVDQATTADAMMGHVQRHRAAADDMRQSIDRMGRQAATDPALHGSRLASIVPQIVASFHRSADVEDELAQLGEELAAFIRAGEFEAAATRAEGLEALINRRIVVAQERAELIGSLGG